MNTKDWLLVIGPLVGVLIGGLITSVAKWWEISTLQKVNELQLKIAHLEALHGSVEKFVTDATDFTYQILRISTPELVHDTDFRLELPVAIRNYTEQLNNLGFKIRLHAPALEPAWGLAFDEVVKFQARAGSFAWAYRRTKDLDERQEMTSVFSAELQLLVYKAVQLEKSILNEIDGLRPEKISRPNLQ